MADSNHSFMNPTEEKWLGERVTRGDREAFGRLYDAYVEPLYRFVYYKTHHTETAEDLTALIFTKALERTATFAVDKSSFKTWLYTIARSTIIDHYRTERPTTDIMDAWDLSDAADIMQDTHTKVELEKIKNIMQTLSSDQRDILVLRLWQQLSYAEVAEILGKSEAACKMGYARAIEALRQKLPPAAFVLVLLNGLFN